MKCLNIVCHGTLFQMISPLWSGTTALDLRQTYREGWQRWARDPKQVALDPAGENLNDIFLDPLELNSPGKLASQKQMVEHLRWFSRRCWSQHSRKITESLKSVLIRLCQPETSSASSMVVRRVHQHADLGLKIRRTPVQNMMLLLHADASLNTGGLVGSQGGYICGVTLLEGRDAPWSPMAWRSFKMSRTAPSSLGAEAQAMSVALGFVEWATLFLQELTHVQIDLQVAPAVMQERPPVCVTDCKSLYDHLSAVGSLSTLHDKRSAIDVLIIRESVKKTGCVIRWAPTRLQLADGLTQDNREAVECLRRSLRSGSYMLRCEEQVTQERHMRRVQKLSVREKKPTAEKS